MIKKRRNIGHDGMLILIIFVLLFLFFIIPAKSSINGVNDEDLNLTNGTQAGSGQCGDACHSSTPSGLLSIQASPCCNYMVGMAGIRINATTSGITENGNISGIMLLNNSQPFSQNIKYEGWVITEDPNNNPTKYNYNQKINLYTLNQTYNWTITAPGTSGTYYIKAYARHGGSTDFNLTSPVLTMIVDGTPPSVISNTNNINVPNGTVLTLNATITDADSGVKNATVNVSGINSTINEAILTNQSGYWVNSSIVADRGDSGGFVNLTITAYDNADNNNNNTNMTVSISPLIYSWSNNITYNNNLSIRIILNEVAIFNITSNYSLYYKWEYDGVDQFNNAGNFTCQFPGPGTHYINATVNYSNLIEYKNWTILVEPETIDVTLSNYPIDFGNVSSGAQNIASVYPLDVTIQSSTNVNVNLTLKGTDFVSGDYSFWVGNMTYSNSSTGTKMALDTSFAIPTYNNWINLPGYTTHVRSIYFWLSIPEGQEPGNYADNVTIQVERYN